jgi:hypothetical protein
VGSEDHDTTWAVSRAIHAAIQWTMLMSIDTLLQNCSNH